MAIRYLYLVRHGQYDRLSDDSGLTKVGHQQAAKTAKYLRQLPLTAIHVSSLRRTVETAAPLLALFPEIKTQPTKRLWECVPYCSADMRPFFPDVSLEQLNHEQLQAETAYTYYTKPTRGKDKYEVLVTHGNLIRYFTCRAMGANPALWLHLESRNCGITRLAVDPQGDVALISYNDLAHLPAQLHTDNMHTP